MAVIGTSRKTSADSHQTRSSCPGRLLCELCRSCDGYFFYIMSAGRFTSVNSCTSAVSSVNITAGTRLGLKEQFTQNAESVITHLHATQQNRVATFSETADVVKL